MYLESENNVNNDCVNISSEFVIVDVHILSKLVERFVKCKYCDINCIKINEIVGSRRGLASKLALTCTVCSKNESCMTSQMANKNMRLI